MWSSWWGSAARYGMLVALLIAVACGDSESSGPVTAPPAAVASVAVAPATASVLVGRQLTLIASPRDAASQPLQRPVTWASANPAIATVSATGVLTALAAGQVRITATSEGKEGSALIDVAQIPVAEVRLSADSEVQLPWNGTAQLAASALDAEGNVLPGRTATWLSSRSTVVTVAPDGRLQAVAPGIALISASIEGKVAHANVRVLPVPVKSIAIDGAADGLEVGETVFLGVTLIGENDAPVQRVVNWSTNAPAVATVEANNPMLVAVQAVAAGRVTISASVDDKTATLGFTVTPRPTHDVVYTRTTDNGRVAELFVLGINGSPSAPVRLNAGTVSREASPSPDGQRLVFAVSQTHPVTGEPQHDLYVVNRNGMGMRQLTSMAGYEHQPTWSPDGSRILFRAAANNSARPDLWVINPDGTGLRNLTGYLGAQQFSDLRDPAWSPDGSQIAFIGAAKGQHHVWLMHSDGTNLRQLVADDGFDSSPTWSPDGQAIAFTRWNTADPTYGEDVMIVPVATGNAHRLALLGDQRTPQWSPDGHYLVVMGTAVAATGVGNIYTMRPDGTGLRLRTVNPAWGGGTAPRWISR